MRISASKTAVPELPPEFTARPQLLDELDRATAAQLVVVIAPAGYGKTLLLADCVRHGGGPSTGWVSLDGGDDDPRRLWSAVLATLTALPAIPPDSSLHRLRRDGAGPDGGNFLDELTEALDVLDQPVRLVLDDVQELTAPDTLHDLARLVRNRPPSLQLVLSSRADPPLSLPRLRLEGRLSELRADSLRFSLDDTAALLRASGLELDAAQVELLHGRTEGWVTGLRLAALALRRADDPDCFLAQFSGDERSVADYLTGEILSALPPESQDFLRAVSVCSRMPADLAAGLSGRSDADWVLDQLGRETALVERASPGEYRIHVLLRSYLVASLERHSPGRYRELHATAARWWADRDDPVHALGHAERSGDSALVTDLLHNSAVTLLLSGELATLRRALAAVPSQVRWTKPWLAFTAAIVHLGEGDLAAAAPELQHARQAWPAGREPGLDGLRASAELLAAGIGLPSTDPMDPRAMPDLTEPEMQALLHASRGAAGLGQGSGGDVDLVKADLERALVLARAHDFGYLEVQSLSLLATLAAVRGDHRGMAAAAEDAVAAAVRQGRHPSAWSAGAMAILAYVALLDGDPVAARERADEALATPDPLPPVASYALRAVRGCALADQGERATGLAELRAARAEFGDTPALPVLPAALALLEHRTALLLGNSQAAAEVAAWLERRVGRVGELLLLRAWTAMAAGRAQSARDAVAPLRSASAPVLLAYTPIEVHLLDAEVAFQAGDLPAGHAALDTALVAGEAVDVVRPFAVAGPRTREVLAGQFDAPHAAPFTARLAAASAAVAPAEAAPLLSERELALLALLPSPLRTEEIAAELTVSVNTAKRHTRALYAKLGVSRRPDAVERGRQRGLLP